MTTIAQTLEVRYNRANDHYEVSPRITWNGGFWDGLSDVRNRRIRRIENAAIQPLPAWSPFYCAGYNEGFNAGADGYNGEDSSDFWFEWVRSRTATGLRSMIKREQGYKRKEVA